MTSANKVKNLIFEQTQSMPDCTSDNFSVGSIDFNISFQKSVEKIANPLDILFCGLEKFQFKCGIKKDAKNIVQIKRIKNTPFYTSYIVDDDYLLQIVDFFEWEPSTKIHRLFLFQWINDRLPLIISFAGQKFECIGDRIVKTGNISADFSEPIEINKEKKDVKLHPNSTDSDELNFAVTFSQNKQIKNSLSFEQTVELFKMLTEECKKQHMQNYFVLKNDYANMQLDTLWTSQKYFLPDGTISPAIIKNIENYKSEISWIIRFAVWFGFDNQLEFIYQALAKSSTVKADIARIKFELYFLHNYLRMREKTDAVQKIITAYLKSGDKKSLWYKILSASKINTTDLEYLTDEELFYYSFFWGNNLISALTIKLQNWWNLYSMPLLNEKLKWMCNNETEKIFIIYLLAMQNKLPWFKVLERHCDNFANEPFFQLLSFVQKRIQIQFDLKNNFIFSPGTEWDTNRIQLLSNNEKYSIKFTRFGKITYSEIQLKNQNYLKIDKEVKINYNHEMSRIIILPNLFLNNGLFEIDKFIEYKINEKTYYLPKIWRQGELSFFAVKIRWILKKRRFQFTCFSKMHDIIFFINNERLNLLKGKKHKHYLEYKDVNPEIFACLYDDQFRTIHFRQLRKQREISVVGHAINQYGILPGFVNYQITGGQQIIKCQTSGNFEVNLKIPSDFEFISLNVKGVKQKFTVKYFSLMTFEKIMRYFPGLGIGAFVLIVDNLLKEKLPEIRNSFYSKFRFEPIYFFGNKLDRHLIKVFVSK